MNLQINGGTYGMYFVPVEAVTFWDFTARDVFVDGTSSDGFYSYDGHGYVLDHFLAEQCGGYGVNFPVTCVAQPEVRNGTFKKNTGGGVFMGAPGGVVAECEFAEITGNAITLYGAGSKATDNTIGVVGEGATGVGIRMYNGNGQIAKGNTVNRCGSYGIEAQQQGAIIVGNYVFANTGVNIYLAASYQTVIGNVAYNGSSYGIQANSAS